MAKKFMRLGVLVMVLVIGMMSVSCATNVAPAKTTLLHTRKSYIANFNKKPIIIAGERQYEILGPVTLEKEWFGILGVSFPGLDAYLYQNGGVTYVDLLNKAKERWADIDAVVDINIDYVGNTYGIFYSKRVNIVSGIAIKYVKGPAGSVFPPNGY